MNYCLIIIFDYYYCHYYFTTEDVEFVEAVEEGLEVGFAFEVFVDEGLELEFIGSWILETTEGDREFGVDGGGEIGLLDVFGAGGSDLDPPVEEGPAFTTFWLLEGDVVENIVVDVVAFPSEIVGFFTGAGNGLAFEGLFEDIDNGPKKFQLFRKQMPFKKELCLFGKKKVSNVPSSWSTRTTIRPICWWQTNNKSKAIFWRWWFEK